MQAGPTALHDCYKLTVVTNCFSRDMITCPQILTINGHFWRINRGRERRERAYPSKRVLRKQSTTVLWACVVLTLPVTILGPSVYRKPLLDKVDHNLQVVLINPFPYIYPFNKFCYSKECLYLSSGWNGQRDWYEHASLHMVTLRKNRIGNFRVISLENFAVLVKLI